jgi:hypothetical protein
MTLKDRIDNNITLYTLGLLLTGFCAGIGAYKFMLDVFGGNASALEECVGESWQKSARLAVWLPSSECPAYPLELKISSPGDNAVIPSGSSSGTWLRTIIVISSTRTIPGKSAVGVVLKPTGSTNYYVVFPYFNSVGLHNTFRVDSLIDLPFKLESQMGVEIRALVIDEKQKMGGVYSTLEQIKMTDQSVFISQPIKITIE